MPNPNLNKEQLVLATQLLEKVTLLIAELSNGNKDLLFAYRRKLAKELG